jgi:hypothetical protein
MQTWIQPTQDLQLVNCSLSKKDNVFKALLKARKTSDLHEDTSDEERTEFIEYLKTTYATVEPGQPCYFEDVYINDTLNELINLDLTTLLPADELQQVFIHWSVLNVYSELSLHFWFFAFFNR